MIAMEAVKEIMKLKEQRDSIEVFDPEVVFPDLLKGVAWDEE